MAHALEVHFTAYNNARVQYSKPEMRWGAESPEEAGNIIIGQPQREHPRRTGEQIGNMGEEKNRVKERNANKKTRR